MSFTRLDFDDCTYKHVLRESIGPGDYHLSTPRNYCNGCFFPSPDVILGRFGGGTCDNVIDVDSELLGITRKSTKCPSEKYIPSATEFCQTKMPQDCFGLTREDTKISNPPCTLRGTGWNRWEWLCTNPQEKALMSFDYNINNRLIVKDNHRPCIPKPVDQSVSLPPSANDSVIYDWSSRYTEPFYDIVSPQLGVKENMTLL